MTDTYLTIRNRLTIIGNFILIFILVVILPISFVLLFPLGGGSVDTVQWQLYPTADRINETMELNCYTCFEENPIIIKMEGLDPLKKYILFQPKSRTHRGFYVAFTNQTERIIIVSPANYGWALYRISRRSVISIIEVDLLKF